MDIDDIDHDIDDIDIDFKRDIEPILVENLLGKINVNQAIDALCELVMMRVEEYDKNNHDIIM